MFWKTKTGNKADVAPTLIASEQPVARSKQGELEDAAKKLATGSILCRYRYAAQKAPLDEDLKAAHRNVDWMEDVLDMAA